MYLQFSQDLSQLASRSSILTPDLRAALDFLKIFEFCATWVWLMQQMIRVQFEHTQSFNVKHMSVGRQYVENSYI